jgi:hypothetical protein
MANQAVVQQLESKQEAGTKAAPRTRRLPPWRIHSGKPGAVLKEVPEKIGSMPSAC